MNLKDNFDVIVSIGVICIIVMMIVPLPEMVLDLLLAFNITISVVIILITMFTTNVLQLSVFPSLLLITTLFRLALNIINKINIKRSKSRGHNRCFWRVCYRWKLCSWYYYILNIDSNKFYGYYSRFW